MKKISNKKANGMNFYIVCPAYCSSGGPELAHQLCYAINKNTIYNAFMYYVDYETNSFSPVDVETVKNYSIYQTEHVTSLEEVDIAENVVIIPEGATFYISAFKKATKVLWWMSVDNYVENTQEQDMELLKKEIQLHLFQSYYASKYVKKKFQMQREYIYQTILMNSTEVFCFQVNIERMWFCTIHGKVIKK